MSLKQKTIKLNQDQNSNAIKLSVEFTTDSSSYTMPFVIVFPQGPHRGKRIDRIPYDDICKLDT